jgi:pyruvate ferredoxin oxidoreductase gamma subunit/2-oxoisovalerate ferredoxin oxidoreductase gamma subunit
MNKEGVKMYEVRFHGRGGQGAVTAANILAAAAFKEGKDVQAFPIFGVERRGAPVAAFMRMDEEDIDIKTQIYEPDAIVVLDPTLLEVVNVGQGLKNDGIAVLNTTKPASAFNFGNAKVFTVDATKIAVENSLGTSTNPIVNTAILGAYSKAVGNVGITAITEAIAENAPIKPKENQKAAQEAYEQTKE